MRTQGGGSLGKSRENGSCIKRAQRLLCVKPKSRPRCGWGAGLGLGDAGRGAGGGSLAPARGHSRVCPAPAPLALACRSQGPCLGARGCWGRVPPCTACRGDRHPPTPAGLSHGLQCLVLDGLLMDGSTALHLQPTSVFPSDRHCRGT